MASFRRRMICSGWALEQFRLCRHSFILITPKDTDFFAIREVLSTLPGSNHKFIYNDVIDGMEIYFSCELPFNETICEVAGLLNLPIPRKQLRQNRMVPVKQYTVDGEYIRTWDGLTQAGKALGINPGIISNVCSGKCQTAGGYKWAKC